MKTQRPNFWLVYVALEEYNESMLRRGFLKQFLTVSALACVPFSSFFQRRKPGILIEDQNLSYLTDFSVFGQLNALLIENGISAKVCIEKIGSRAPKSRMVLATLNSSYGRFSNFGLEDLKLALQNNPGVARKMFIKTAGPSGKNLSLNSAWNVIGKNLRSDEQNVFFVSDAYPHFYNYKLLTKFNPQGSYFLDRTSRKSILLSLEIQSGEEKIQGLKSKISKLQETLQKDFDVLENRSMAFIRTKMKTHSFEDLLALAPAKKLQGLNFKA